MPAVSIVPGMLARVNHYTITYLIIPTGVLRMRPLLSESTTDSLFLSKGLLLSLGGDTREKAPSVLLLLAKHTGDVGRMTLPTV